MAVFVVREVKLTESLTVTIGTEITCQSKKDPRFTRGVIVGAWIGEVFASWSIYGAYVPMIEIEYGPFSETRQLDQQGCPV